MSIIERQILEPLLDSGMSRRAIARHLGTTRIRVDYACSKHGLTSAWAKRQRENKDLSLQRKKRCATCNRVRDYEDFPVDSRATDGLSSQCKDEREASIIAWNQANPEKRLKISREWKTRNPEKIQEYSAKWYAENSELNKIRLKEWFSRNPQMYVVYRHQRTAREQGAKGKFTAVQLKARIEFYGGLCYLCGAIADTIDHVIPLSKGGTNWPANLRPACRSCNSRKGTKRHPISVP